ncbi:MAG: LTA synthase family protein [Eubacteriales bacterium]|nr:LTA synthase family protein [Eubacteriales bacterium]
MKKMILPTMALLLAVIFVLIPWKKVEEWIRRKCGRCPDLNRLLTRLLFLASPLASYYIVWVYSGYTSSGFVSRLLGIWGFCNLILYGSLLWLFYLLCNRAKYAAMMLTIASSVLGLANYFVMSFRGTPILIADFMSLGTAADVASGYHYVLNVASAKALMYTAAFCIMLVSLKSYRWLGWKKRIVVLIGFVCIFCGLNAQFFSGKYFKTNKIKLSVWNPEWNYNKLGALLSLTISYSYYHVEKPDDYSVKKIEALADEFVSDKAETSEGQIQPNVIAIMNETFADMEAIGRVETSEEILPFFNSLTENTVRGGLYVSIRGSMTANSEFEFLTGCSMAFFPFRSIPYNNYIKSELPSLTTTLKDQGYGGNIALHPGEKNSWSRDRVYPMLGFEKHVAKEAFEDTTLVHNYVSDEAGYEYLENAYEEYRKDSEKPFYFFNVTIQNHAGYEVKDGLVEAKITLENKEEWSEEMEQYINLLKISDDAFKELIGYFSKVEEPTVIVMFGDHQPKFLPADGASYGTAPIERYRVPYLIWANYDIEEETKDMSVNYLSSYLLKTVKAQMTGYDKYLLNLQKEIPIFTANGYMGADGVIYELNDESSPYKPLVDQYRMVQWNNIFDAEHRLDEFFYLQ